MSGRADASDRRPVRRHRRRVVARRDELAYSSDRDGSMDIWIRDLRAGTDVRLTSLPDAEMGAAWSPDGTRIAFVSNQDLQAGRALVVSAAGGTPRKILDRAFGDGYPSWTGNGRFIVASAIKPVPRRATAKG